MKYNYKNLISNLSSSFWNYSKSINIPLHAYFFFERHNNWRQNVFYKIYFYKLFLKHRTTQSLIHHPKNKVLYISAIKMKCWSPKNTVVPLSILSSRVFSIFLPPSRVTYVRAYSCNALSHPSGCMRTTSVFNVGDTIIANLVPLSSARLKNWARVYLLT